MVISKMTIQKLLINTKALWKLKIFQTRDSYNHTGYAQVLEEWSLSGSVPDKTYTIGDDVITQYDGTSAEHFLYDGHGSVRQLSNSSGGIVTDQVFSYDAYGVSIGYTGTKDTRSIESTPSAEISRTRRACISICIVTQIQ